MSGVAVDDMGPGSVLAAQMAAEDIGGSVAGMKIEIVFADHLQKPDVGATIVRRWFDQENVDAVADVPNSSVALAINQIARADNKVLLPSSSQSLELTAAQCSPNTVRWTIDTWAHLAQPAVGPDERWRRQDLVLRAYRQRLWPRPDPQRHRGGDHARRQGGRHGGASARHHRLLVVRGAGRLVGRGRDRAGELQRGPDQLPQAGERIRPAEGRPADRGVRAGYQQCPRGRAEADAGPVHRDAVLLGPRRRHARRLPRASCSAIRCTSMSTSLPPASMRR